MPVKPGGIASIQDLKRVLRKAPVSVSIDAAKRAAPAMTRQARQANANRQSVYGEQYPQSEVTGDQLTLVRTGETARRLRFYRIGTTVRCELGTPWARYLIGKYGILPNRSLPASWSRELNRIVAETDLAKAVGS